MYDKNEIENVSDDYIKYLLNTFNEWCECFLCIIKEIGPQADFLGNGNYQQGTAINKNILVEEREFMRMERDCEADEHL